MFKLFCKVGAIVAFVLFFLCLFFVLGTYACVGAVDKAIKSPEVQKELKKLDEAIKEYDQSVEDLKKAIKSF